MKLAIRIFAFLLAEVPGFAWAVMIFSDTTLPYWARWIAATFFVAISGAMGIVFGQMTIWMFFPDKEDQ